MSNKEIKSWGKIGGLASMSKSWGVPAEAWLFWPAWRKESNYTTTTYTGTDDELMEFARGITADIGSEEMTYHELSFSTGAPLAKLTVKTGTAYKLHFDCNMKEIPETEEE